MTLRGFGIGLRNEHVKALETTTRSIDWLEIIAENWVDTGGKKRADLARLAERWPLVPHGVTMSIGGPDALDQRLFRGMNRLCREVRAPFWSDHVCASVIDGTYFNDLLPVPTSEGMLEHVLGRIAAAGRMSDVPLVFENPSYYVELPGGTLSQATFLREVIVQSGAGLLLDVNNVYVNSQNHGFDPEAFIRALPLGSVRQIHLAGHTRHAEVVIDTHVGPIPDAVWSLYRFTLQAIGRQVPTLIEWDAEIPALDVVCDELDRARSEARLALAGLEEAA